MKKKSNWKLPFIHSIFFKKRLLYKKSLITKIRNSNIPNNFINNKIKIYNGIWYLSQDIISSMVGHGFKLGSYSYTRRSDSLIHSKIKKKKKINK